MIEWFSNHGIEIFESLLISKRETHLTDLFSILNHTKKWEFVYTVRNHVNICKILQYMHMHAILLSKIPIQIYKDIIFIWSYNYVTYLLFFYQKPYYHIHMCIIEFAHMYIYYIYHYKYAFIYCIFSLNKKENERLILPIQKLKIE